MQTTTVMCLRNFAVLIDTGHQTAMVMISVEADCSGRFVFHVIFTVDKTVGLILGGCSR